MISASLSITNLKILTLALILYCSGDRPSLFTPVLNPEVIGPSLSHPPHSSRSIRTTDTSIRYVHVRMSLSFNCCNDFYHFSVSLLAVHLVDHLVFLSAVSAHLLLQRSVNHPQQYHLYCSHHGNQLPQLEGEREEGSPPCSTMKKVREEKG